MKTTETTETSTIADLAIGASQVRFAEDFAAPFVALPAGCIVHDVERTLPCPIRKRGTITVRDVDSFISIVEAQASESTTLYRTIDPPSFVAVFNDHGSTESGLNAGWGDHKAIYKCPLSPEWATWTAANKRVMAQVDFAQFIEDNLPDIADPTAAEMLEISRTLQAKKKVNFASGIRLDNGQQQFTYEENIDGRAGSKGQIRVPEVFTVGIPVFEGGSSYAVRARLRYRIADHGTLSMWFDLERPHKIIEDAVEQLRMNIESSTGRLTINGSRDS